MVNMVRNFIIDYFQQVIDGLDIGRKQKSNQILLGGCGGS